MGGGCVSGGGTGQRRVPVGEQVCRGRIPRGGPYVWSKVGSHGVRRAGRQGVRGPGGHWRVCSVELMTDRRYKATLRLVFPRDFGGDGVGWGRVDRWQGGQF